MPDPLQSDAQGHLDERSVDDTSAGAGAMAADAGAMPSASGMDVGGDTTAETVLGADTGIRVVNATASPCPATSVPANVHTYRGVNHVLVSRTSKTMSLLQRSRKLLKVKRFKEIYLHALGAAVPTAIVLASRLVQESDGRLVMSANTSSEVIVDHPDFLSGEETKFRHNSAIHIRVSWVETPRPGQGAFAAEASQNAAAGVKQQPAAQHHGRLGKRKHA